MLTQLCNWVGDVWVGEMLDELEQIADQARLKSNFSKFKGSAALGNSRQLNADSAGRSRSSLLLAMAQYDQHLCNKTAGDAEQAYGQVLGPLFYVLKWLAPIYSSALARAPLTKLIESAATCMDGYRCCLQTRQAWLSFLEELIGVWSNTPLQMRFVEPGPKEVSTYGGNVFVRTGSDASRLLEYARRVSLYATQINASMGMLHPDGEQRIARNTRSALIAAESALNGRYAHELRYVVSRFEDLYLAASSFWRLEESGRILPEEQQSVCQARNALAEATRAACINVHQVYQAQLRQGDTAKQQFQLALSLINA